MSALKELTGRTFGEWTVIGRAGVDPWKSVRWMCRCSCGKERVVTGSLLRYGRSTSCGHGKNADKVIGEIGSRYGSLEVLARAEGPGARWECRCDCGNLTIVPGRMLRSGNTRSCGHVDEIPTYKAMHARIDYRQGPASEQKCVHCDGVASEWAYDHADPDYRLAVMERGGRSWIARYSVKDEHYIPLCTSCHIRFDRSSA